MIKIKDLPAQYRHCEKACEAFDEAWTTKQSLDCFASLGFSFIVIPDKAPSESGGRVPESTVRNALAYEWTPPGEGRDVAGVTDKRKFAVEAQKLVGISLEGSVG